MLSAVWQGRGWLLTLGCVGAVVAIWLADRIAAEDLRFGFVYLVPLAVVAWWGRRSVALGCAALASLAVVVNDLQFRAGSTVFSNVWNEFTRATTLVAVVVLVSSVRASAVRARSESERAFVLAVTDQLTGLYNRRYLMEQLNRVHAAAARQQRPYALVALDLDGFKLINDMFGHVAGDAALIDFANDLRRAIRAGDIAVRMGGDEFLVLLPDGTADHAAALAERLLTTLREAPSDERRIHNFSAGVVSWRPKTTPEDLIAEADHLVYESKRRGGGQVTTPPAIQSA
jgi:diguanylate cyclase (GGDEF)-like protein